MKIKNILKKNKLDLLSWQYIYYHLRYEKKFNVDIKYMKGDSFSGDILEYLISKEFVESQTLSRPFTLINELLRENKTLILNNKKVTKDMTKFMDLSYMSVYSLNDYIQSRVDITHTPSKSRLKHNPQNIFLYISYIKESEGKIMNSKKYVVNIEKIVEDLGLTGRTKTSISEELGLIRTTYCNILTRKGLIKQSTLTRLQEHLKETRDFDVLPYCKKLTIEELREMKKEIGITDDLESIINEEEKQNDELTQEILDYCEKDIDITEKACDRHGVKPIREQNIDVNKLIEQVDTLLDIIKIVINK